MDGRATDERQGTRRERGRRGMRANVRRALRTTLTAVGLPDKAAPLTFYAALCVLAGLTSLRRRCWAWSAATRRRATRCST